MNETGLQATYYSIVKLFVYPCFQYEHIFVTNIILFLRKALLALLGTYQHVPARTRNKLLRTKYVMQSISAYRDLFNNGLRQLYFF